MNDKRFAAMQLLDAIGDVDADLINDAWEYMRDQKRVSAAAKAKRIAPKALLVAALVAIPATAAANSNISSAVKDKVSSAGLSDKDIAVLSSELGEEGETAEEIKKKTPLAQNENGQTYGPDAFNPELVLVQTDEGADGYVYADELDSVAKSPVETENNGTKAKTLTVYEEDGSTPIGHFTIGS